MKKLLSILTMLLIGFTACQKDSEITKPEDNNSSGGTVVNLASIPLSTRYWQTYQRMTTCRFKVAGNVPSIVAVFFANLKTKRQ